MRTADIVLRSGDRLPAISRTVSIDGALLDLTGYTATFNYQPIGGGLLTTRAATIPAPATMGTVTYAWSATDSYAKPGYYAAWFEVTSNSQTLSVPNDGFLLLEVIADGSAEFSYTGDPSLRPLDAVRYLIQDVDPASPQQRDSEITWNLSEHNGNVYLAAAACADTISARYASYASQSRTVGDLTISEQRADRATEYANLAMRLRAQAARQSPPLPTAGGLDTPNQFTLGEFDNPEVTVIPLKTIYGTFL